MSGPLRRRNEPRGAGRLRRARVLRSASSRTATRSSSSATRARAAGASLDPGTRTRSSSSCARASTIFRSPSSLAAARAPLCRRPRSSSGSPRGSTCSTGPRDADERQRTLRAAIAWSHELLERARAAALPASRGASSAVASLAAIEHVCDADLEDLLSVVSKSLVRAEPSRTVTEPRYWMLETIREFAAEQLEASDELDDLRDRHLAWFVRLPRAGASEELAGTRGRAASLASSRTSRTQGGVRRGRSSAPIGPPRVDPRHRAAAVATSCADGMPRRTTSRVACSRSLEPLDAAFFHDRLRCDRAPRSGRPARRSSSYLAESASLDGARPIATPTWWERWIDLKLDKAQPLLLRERSGSARAALMKSSSLLSQSTGHLRSRLDLMHVATAAPLPAASATRCRRRPRRSHGRSYDARRAAGVVPETSPWASASYGGESSKRQRRTSSADGRSPATRGIALIEMRCLMYGLARAASAQRRRGRTRAARELESFDELHGYEGLVSACAAWVAYRDGDTELVVQRASSRSLTGLRRSRRLRRLRSGQPGFRCSASRSHEATSTTPSSTPARCSIRSQQPLPDEIAAAVERAVDIRSRRGPAVGARRRPTLRLLVGVKRSSQLRTRERSSALGCRPRRGNRPQCGHSRRAAMRRHPSEITEG